MATVEGQKQQLDARAVIREGAEDLSALQRLKGSDRYPASP